MTLSDAWYLKTGRYRFKGSLILAARWPQVLHASPVSLALNTNAHDVAFRGAPSLSWTSAWSVNTSYQPVGRLSSQSPSCSHVLTVPLGFLFFFGFVFSSRVASCRKSGLPCGSFFFFPFKDIITNAHQLTGTRLDLFINSLWFNSLTLLPCYANSCGQSMTPLRWGFGQIIFA